MERGLYETKDAALLFRSLEAAHLYRIAEKASRDLKSLSPDEDAIYMEMSEKVSEQKPKVTVQKRARSILALGEPHGE